MDFDGFVRDIVQNGWQVHGVEAYRHGRLIGQYGDVSGLYPIYSATKSVASIAAGMAIDEGKLDVSKSILAYLPPERLRRLSQAQTEALRHVTLHRLMSMSVRGFPFRASGEDWLDFSLNCPLPDPERPTFEYSNIPAYLTGVAVTHAMGQDAGLLIQERILAPLGIERYLLGRCPQGYFYGASGMELSVHDLSKLGLLMLQGGVYHGKRIVSEAYVRQATAVQQRNREGGYGYFFWKYRNGFSINGKWKQKCYVLPEQGLVIAFLSHIQEGADGFLQSMERHLLGIDA